MNPHGLFASAAINMGLAFLILSLFSVLKKRPSNASVYYARPLSHRRQIPVHFPSSSLRRFLPSLAWVFRAFRVTEAEILDAHGLDSLVIIRLFKFGSVHLPTSSLGLFNIHFLPSIWLLFSACFFHSLKLSVINIFGCLVCSQVKS